MWKSNIVFGSCRPIPELMANQIFLLYQPENDIGWFEARKALEVALDVWQCVNSWPRGVHVNGPRFPGELHFNEDELFQGGQELWIARIRQEMIHRLGMTVAPGRLKPPARRFVDGRRVCRFHGHGQSPSEARAQRVWTRFRMRRTVRSEQPMCCAVSSLVHSCNFHSTTCLSSSSSCAIRCWN